MLSCYPPGTRQAGAEVLGCFQKLGGVSFGVPIEYSRRSCMLSPKGLQYFWEHEPNPMIFETPG